MKPVVVRNIKRADANAVGILSGLGVSTVHEAQGRIGLMKPYMRPIWPGAEIEFFDAGDYPLRLTPEMFDRMVDVYRETNPSFVLTHALEDPYNFDHPNATHFAQETRIVAQSMGHKPSATAERHYINRPLELLALWHRKYERWILEQAGIAFEDNEAATGPGLRVVGGAA